MASGSGFAPDLNRMTDLVTPDEFRAALGRFASGVTVITVETADGEVHGMTASAFCSVSLRPPLVLVCIDHLAETYLHIRERRQFGVSVLKEEQEALSEFFADPERNQTPPIGWVSSTVRCKAAHRSAKRAGQSGLFGGAAPTKPATTPSSSAK